MRWTNSAWDDRTCSEVISWMLPTPDTKICQILGTFWGYYICLEAEHMKYTMLEQDSDDKNIVWHKSYITIILVPNYDVI
jgi:hypothetical protein